MGDSRVVVEFLNDGDVRMLIIHDRILLFDHDGDVLVDRDSGLVNPVGIGLIAA